MLEIIPGILTEQEFRFFTEKSYEILEGVMDDVIASYLLQYMENPEADQKIVAMMRACCETTIKSLTFHKVLRERGILDMIAKLSPEAVAMSGEDYKEVYSQLKFLEENRHLLLARVPKRSVDAYRAFKSMVMSVVNTMYSKGVTPTYSDISERLSNNEFLFYIPNDKGHSTYASIVITKENTWTIVLRGIEYREYCDSHGIGLDRRSVF